MRRVTTLIAAAVLATSGLGFTALPSAAPASAEVRAQGHQGGCSYCRIYLKERQTKAGTTERADQNTPIAPPSATHPHADPGVGPHANPVTGPGVG